MATKQLTWGGLLISVAFGLLATINIIKPDLQLWWLYYPITILIFGLGCWMLNKGLNRIVIAEQQQKANFQTLIDEIKGLREDIKNK